MTSVPDDLPLFEDLEVALERFRSASNSYRHAADALSRQLADILAPHFVPAHVEAVAQGFRTVQVGCAQFEATASAAVAECRAHVEQLQDPPPS